MFKDILFTFLGLDYRDVTLIKLYFVVLGLCTDGRTDPNYRKASLLITLSLVTIFCNHIIKSQKEVV